MGAGMRFRPTRVVAPTDFRRPGRVVAPTDFRGLGQGRDKSDTWLELTLLTGFAAIVGLHMYVLWDSIR